MKRSIVANGNAGRWLSVALLLVSIVTTRAAEGDTNEPAKVKVSGFGFFGNREMVRLLRNFQVDGEMPRVIDRTFVEDAALIMFARATDEGFLRAALLGDFQLLNGSQRQFFWTNALDVSLSRDFAARTARFKLVPGVRFHYETITFEGLEAFSEDTARSYFVSSDTLLRLERNRIFNPTELRSSLGALQEAYMRAGYANAYVTTNAVTVNERTGEVTVEVLVREGRLHWVQSVDVTVAEAEPDAAAAPERRRLTPNEPFSELWQQELARELRAEQYARGFPDATVEFSTLRQETNVTQVDVVLAARVSPGPLVRLGDVKFVGNKRTQTSLLDRRVTLEEGEPLNRLAAERSRQRLARLGVFNTVDLQLEEVDEHTRNAIFRLEEIKPMTLSVFGGFGSYELLRGGLEFQHRNVLGRAHNLRLRGMQSFKASKGDAVYTVPELFGENVNGFLQSSGERREEVSFTRQEYGGSAGIQKRFVPIQTDFTLRYDYEFLRALDLASVNTNRTGVQDAKSAAFVIELNRDRRDHPLLPREGLKLYTRAEFASDVLGGTVDYQRLILGASYHHDWGGGRLMHLGLTHGISFTFGGSDQDLPFNRRFFPGGENSVRGYQQGEASPVDANGVQLGAETYTQANLEFEQLLTKTWSVVLFCDAVGFAFDRGDYPVDETLVSVGAGIRWRTLIGPVRLEYGHNLNRRTHDPAGTLHFSVGFPF